MLNLIPFLACLALCGCASLSQEERHKETVFEMQTPYGPVQGKVVEKETSHAETKSGPDTARIADGLEKAAGYASWLGPWAGAAGLALAALLKHRKQGAAEAAAALAREALTRVSTAVDTFKDGAGDASVPLLAELSRQLDKPHKMLIRELKP